MYFSLLFTQRTGSHFLRSCLWSHPKVDDIYVESHASSIIREGGELWPPTDLMIGNKIPLDTVYEQDRFDIIREPAIVTYRNNKLSQYISFVLAIRENRWGAYTAEFGGHLIGGDEIRDISIDHPASAGRYRRGAPSHYSEQPIYINIERAVTTIAFWNAIEERVKKEIPNALWLEYGQLIAGDGLIRAQEFLGLQVQKLRTVTLKQSSGINIEYVENIEEIMNSELAGWL